MSETDDTDVLLLIPPNFFLVHSSGSEDSILDSSRTVVHRPLSCTAQVLDKLVNQVQTLETRLESLEVSSEVSTLDTRSRNKTWNSTDSIDTHSIDRKCFTFPRRRRRKFIKREKQRDLSLTSLDSTSTLGTTVPRLKLHEDINVYSKPIKSVDLQSMDGDISSIVSTPNKKNDKLLLHEIDEFLTKVEAYESPESRYKHQDSNLSPENVIKATGDYITSKLSSKNDDIKLPSGRTISGNVLDKYIYLVKNNNPTQQDKPLQTQNTTVNESQTKPSESKVHDNKDIDPKSPSVRRLNFEKDVQPTSTPKKPQSCLDTFRPTSNKVYDRATKVLEQYKAQNYSRNTQNSVDSYTMSPKTEFKLPQMRPFAENRESMKLLQNKFMDSIDTDLLSLSDLWGDNREKGDREGVKLEEERLKREHCEAMIQQLQRKILEQQEKLAVAVKVDKAKDAAIAKLREAWLKLTGSLDKAEERHRNALEKMMREVDNFRMVADDAQKKTRHFESELYKALDLAHDYQEKCKLLVSEKKDLQENMEKSLAAKNEVISNKDKEIEVLKENYETVMRLNKQSTDCVKNLEDALEKEKSSHESTKQKSKDLYDKVQSLTDETTIILQERDVLKEKVNEERARCNILERQLADKQNQCSDLVKKCDFLDNEVKNLRKHMELQKNELKSHYQKQLEDAVLSKLQEFQQQLDLAEKDMESEARSKENGIVDSFNKQIVRIEEQHRLEVNVLEEKQREEIKLYRLQLAQASEKIGLLESKLESYRRRRGEMASQLHGVMQAQWTQALRILTSGQHHPDTAVTTPLPSFVPESVAPRRHLAAPSPSAPPGPPTGLTQSLPHGLAPVSPLNVDGLTDTELQHYVKMLLTKPPNFDGSGDTLPADPHREYNEEPTSDRPDRHDRKDKAKRSLNPNKPPWKA
ncbi:centromere-associated protein E [Manduca sexta]|uniref:centromere-associated protein E n=1 Tax=Manduca sexta TaxID=7130 RepID=UPI00188EB7DA|nr:centromere-associated protein E [Manduca sexta]